MLPWQPHSNSRNSGVKALCPSDCTALVAAGRSLAGSAPGARRAEVRSLDVHLPQGDGSLGGLPSCCSSSFPPSPPS